MGANRLSENTKTVDYRLVLIRNQDRIESALTLLQGEGGGTVTHQCDPDWDVIESGLDALQNPRVFGGTGFQSASIELGMAAFGTPILHRILGSCASATVRVWLAPDETLAHLPWEAATIASPEVEGRLGLHPGVHLLRGAIPSGTSARRNGKETRVLVVWADPSSDKYRHLPGIQLEVRSVTSALDSPECKRFLVRELPYASTLSLRKCLLDWQPDILHFIGHGDCAATGSVLVLESGEQHVESLMYADEAADIISQAGVRWVVLSGCLTGVAASGVGTLVASMGPEAVVAMQAPMGDLSAGMFARAFYGTIGEGSSIEEAVQQGRSAIQAVNNDWAVPVLFRPFVEEGEGASDDPDPDLGLPKHNLTYDSRPFVGRAKELEAIAERVRDPNCRLLTITGMGGMGKTRIGKQVASDLVPDFSDGVWMVECESLVTRESLIGAIAGAVGAYVSFGDIEKTLAQAIGSRRLLLLLDCFEQVAVHSDVLDRLLAATPNCKILVTSRKVLDIQSEFEYRLAPMTLSKKVKDSSDSMTLFEQAARYANHDFRIDPGNRSMVRDLCHQLEGVPLALSLAAGRLKTLSLSEVLEQVRKHPLQVLKRKGPTADRHADMHRVVSDSFRLLEESELKLMDLLSLFAGGFGLEDASEVCAWDREEMQDGLSRLRDNSLIQVTFQADKSRYKLLDTVREYTEQCDRSPDAEALRTGCAGRHAVRYSRTAKEVGRLMGEGRWTEGTDLMWAEVGNLRAAFTYCAREEKYEMVRDLFDTLGRTLFECGLFEDFEALAKAAETSFQALGDRRLETRVLGLSGALAAVRKDEPLYTALWMRRIELCRVLGDSAGAADSFGDLSSEARMLGKYELAFDYLRQAYDLALEADDVGAMAGCLAQEALMSIQRGDLEKARQVTKDLERHMAMPIPRDVEPFLYQCLARLYRDLGEPKEARRVASKGLARGLEGRRVRMVCWTVEFLGSYLEAAEEFEMVGRIYLASVKLNRETPTKYATAAKENWARFEKNQPELAASLTAVYRRTNWPDMLQNVS